MTTQQDEMIPLSNESTEMRPKGTEFARSSLITESAARAAEVSLGGVRVRSLIESLTEGMVVIDHAATIVLVNQRIQEMFGYGQDELVGHPLNVLVPEQSAQVHGAYVSDFLANPRTRPMGQGRELAGRRKDGTEFPVEISLNALNTDAGTLGMALVSDISIRKQVEEELRQRNEALDAFAHTVAHDLTTSVALLVGYSEILAEQHPTLPADELHRYLKVIAQHARKMNRIINEILLFASIRKEDVPISPLDMPQIVRETLSRLDFEIKESQAQISLPFDFPVALGSAPWVEEVWFNYITNALKYGGRPPRVELGSSVQDDGYVRFWVKDNGVGLTPEQQAKLFKASTGLEHPDIKGHGLGLSIVRRIVEKLNGRVSAESQSDAGSIFSFTLPRDI